MARTIITHVTTRLLAVGAIACGTAYADRPAPHHAAVAAPAPSVAESPYSVELIAQNGQTLDTYQHRGRFYVLGSAGERYTVRVENPTGRRVEAVISVDGLDVIDGESADLGKRGYIVPAYGELRVEGFRTSTTNVATFRFSSVASSYAGRKGKARNVGVIGVAIFEEQAPPQIIHRPPYHAPARPTYDRDWTDDGYHGGAEGEAAPARPSSKAEAQAEPAPAADAPAPASGSIGLGNAPRGRATRDSACCSRPPSARPGLGTQYGEQRYSSVSWTRFVRASSRPVAVAELRYNDRPGLEALGIRLTPHVDHEELITRETAEPFPGQRFAQPPR